MKKVAALLLTLLLVLVAAVPAAAAPPVIVRDEFDWTYLEEDVSALCGFIVFNYSVGSTQLTTYYDNEGNATGFRWAHGGTDELFRPETPNIRLTGHYREILLVDYVTGSVSAPGAYWSITVPGYGIVFKESGLWRYPHPGRLVGIHTSLDPAKMALFCSLLSGG